MRRRSRSKTPAHACCSTRMPRSMSPVSMVDLHGRCGDASRDADRRRHGGGDRAGQAGAAHLHERHDRQAQGRDARSRQPDRDGRHDHGGTGLDGRRSLPADPAAVPCQRHPRQRAVPARRRRLHVGHRSLLALDVLRHRRSGSPDLLLRRARDLRHAERATRRRRSRHIIGALRGLRRGSHARRAHRAVRAAVRHDDRRGLRPLRVHLRRDHQPDRRAPQARHRGAAVARPGRRPARSRGAGPRPTAGAR